MRNKRNINVLIDLERLRYPNSGIANVFRNLALGLSKIYLGKDINLSVFGPVEQIDKIGTSFKIIRRKSIHKIIPFYTYKYKIVHTSHQLSSYFHFKWPGQKKIVTLHDLNFVHENISKKKYQKELKKVKNNIENADVIVCISNFVKNDFIKNKELFVFGKEPLVEVIHNGIYKPDINKKYNLDKFPFLNGKKYILSIGVLFPKKNQLSLIKMLPFMEEDLVLVVSGEQPKYANKIKQKIKKLGVEDRVHFCNNITELDKLSLIQNCTSMCHPSKAEGFGIPPIEAMCFGKPIFLSNLTSLPEIGGEFAFYFENFETKNMLSVYKNGLEYFEKNKESYQNDLITWSDQFDFTIMAKKYLTLYKSL